MTCAWARRAILRGRDEAGTSAVGRRDLGPTHQIRLLAADGWMRKGAGLTAIGAVSPAAHVCVDEVCFADPVAMPGQPPLQTLVDSAGSEPATHARVTQIKIRMVTLDEYI